MLANAKRKIRDFHIHFSNKNSIFLYRYLAHRSSASSTSTARNAPPNARIRRKTLLLTAVTPDTARAVLPLPIPWKEETRPTRPLLAPPGRQGRPWAICKSTVSGWGILLLFRSISRRKTIVGGERWKRKRRRSESFTTNRERGGGGEEVFGEMPHRWSSMGWGREGRMGIRTRTCCIPNFGDGIRHGWISFRINKYYFKKIS